jgi:hypothetical protein
MNQVQRIADVRPAGMDETPLSPDEIVHGFRHGQLDGPIARAHAFAEVTVVTRQRVEIINFTEDSPC